MYHNVVQNTHLFKPPWKGLDGVWFNRLVLRAFRTRQPCGRGIWEKSATGTQVCHILSSTNRSSKWSSLYFRWFLRIKHEYFWYQKTLNISKQGPRDPGSPRHRHLRVLNLGTSPVSLCGVWVTTWRGYQFPLAWHRPAMNNVWNIYKCHFRNFGETPRHIWPASIRHQEKHMFCGKQNVVEKPWRKWESPTFGCEGFILTMARYL